MDKHSREFEKVKKWYCELHKPISWIRNAVLKGFITQEEFEEITGREYTQ